MISVYSGFSLHKKEKVLCDYDEVEKRERNVRPGRFFISYEDRIIQIFLNLVNF